MKRSLSACGLSLLLAVPLLACSAGSLLQPAATPAGTPAATATPPVTPAPTATPAPESPLLEFLRYVPDEANYRSYLTYGDAAAWHASWGVPRVYTLEQVMALDLTQRGLYMATLPEQTTPPDSLGLYYISVEDQRAFYGFDFFMFDRYLLAGRPPGWLTVADYRGEPAKIGAALMASGYTTVSVPGGTLYSIMKDYAVDFKFPSAVGRIGDRNRIALLGERMLMAKATGVVTGALASHAGTVPSLADAPEYRAAVAALDDPALADTGELVGVILMSPGNFADMTKGLPPLSATVAQKQLEEWAQTAPLPDYTLVAFATRHTQGASSLILAVVFPAGTDAPVAAESLAARLKGYTSLSTRTAIDKWTFDRAADVEVAGLPVALVIMRVGDPVPDPQTGSAGLAFAWEKLVMRRDVLFLATTRP